MNPTSSEEPNESGDAPTDLPAEHQEQESETSTGQVEEPMNESTSAEALPLYQGIEELAKEENSEVKLQKGVDLMERALSHAKTPQFKVFWETRKLCMPLFKEPSVNPNLRGLLWDRATELTKEARRLKEILDEQTAFAVEQIEMAIAALEADIEAVATAAKSHEVQFGLKAKSLEERYPFYQPIQQELDLLNNYATRINSLRKELIRTEMRVRQKNKFFQRLSQAGDKVFPKRKELIKQISQAFIADVELFVAKNLTLPSAQIALSFVREEIKAFQLTAKTLTLNTHSFTKTRSLLSEGWEKVKSQEKDRKKERHKLRGLYKENAAQIQEQIQQFEEAFKQGEYSNEQAKKRLDELSTEMRQAELGYEELPQLKERLKAARQLLHDRLHQEELARKELSNEKERVRLGKVAEIREKVLNLIEQADGLEVEQISASREELLELIKDKVVNKFEKSEMEKQLKQLKELIAEKRERALLLLSDNDLQNLNQLRIVLRERAARRDEIKEQLERLRKSAGNTGFDFQQAMLLSEQQSLERERLERANEGIEEIQQKISELRKKVSH